MAKKTPQLKIDFDKQFKITIPGGAEGGFKNDLKRGEVCLNYEIRHGDLTTMESIYPDGLSTGEMKITGESGGIVSVSLKGTVVRDLDEKFEAELIFALQKDSQLLVRSTGLSDSNPTDYHIDGDEEKFLEVGKASLL